MPRETSPASTFSAIGRPGLPDLVVRAIQQRIEQGDLREGDRLPAEPELAASFGVGRSTIREALKALTILGYVRRSNAGTFVGSGDSIGVGHLPDDELLPQTVDRIFRARLMLEPGIAAAAADSAEAADISILEATVANMSEASDVLSLMSADLDFHRGVTRATHDPLLVRLGDLLHTDLAIVHRAYESVFGWPETRESAMTDHGVVIDALRRRDPETAEVEVRRLLLASRARIRAAIGAGDEVVPDKFP